MKRGLYAAGAAVLLALLLNPVFGVEWVDVGGRAPTAAPQHLAPPAGNSHAAVISEIPNTQPPSLAGVEGTFGLDYIYIDPASNYIWALPWYGAYTSGMRFQELYTSSQIGRNGVIHEMALFKDYYGSYYPSSMPNCNIKLCNTTVSTLTNPMSNNYGGGTPVSVYKVNPLNRGIANTWDSIIFTTDFTYDNTKNLLVEITWGNTSGSGYTYSWCTPVSFNACNYTMGDSGAPGNSGTLMAYQHNTRIGFNPPAKNAGVTKIIQPNDPFNGYGDTIYPTAEVRNLGSAAQTAVPVHCLIYNDATNAKIYDQIVYRDLPVGKVDTVVFPYCLPPASDAKYDDTMRTELVGDARPSDDMKMTVFNETQWGSLCYWYYDGTWENGTRYITSPYDGEYLTQFKVVGNSVMGCGVWFTDSSANVSNRRIRVYRLDGTGGAPNTRIFDTIVPETSLVWPSVRENKFNFPTPVAIPSADTLIGIAFGWNSNVAGFVGINMTPPITTGNDWGRSGSSAPWDHNLSGYNDAQSDLGIEACFKSRLIDASVVGISVPPAQVDSNTTFTPVIQIKNVGLHMRQSTPFTYSIITDTNRADTIYKGTGNGGRVNVGQTKSVALSIPFTPLPNHLTMTAISLCPYDYNYSNDTFAAPLFVRYIDVNTRITSPRKNEVPGLVPVMIKLINRGNVNLTVPRLDVTISPAGYADYRENIAMLAAGTQVVTLNPWVAPAGMAETIKAWITYPADMNHGTTADTIWADTAKYVCTTGIPGWAELNPLPAMPSGKPIQAGGWLAYDGGTDAIYGSKGNKTGDFYAFKLPAGTWANLAGIPYGSEGKQVSTGSVGCADGNGNLYMTKGNNTFGFWQYSAGSNAWTQKTDVPGGASGKKVKAGAAMAWATHLGTGYAYLLKGYRNEFYRYDPATNSWRTLLDAPIGTAGHVKWQDGSWLVSDPTPGAHMLYAFKSQYHEMYKYDTDGDSWSGPLHALPIPGPAGAKKAKTGSCAAWYSGKIYALKGAGTGEFWRYFPAGDSWHTQDQIPLVGNSGSRKGVKAGGSLAGYPGTGVYAFKGNKSWEFWRFTPYDVAAAEPQPSRGGVMANSMNIGNVSFAIAPNPLMGGLATVRYNLPSAGLVTLSVFDVTGRTVVEQTMAAGRTGTANLDLRKLDAGVYLVKVATDGYSATQKLVVEH